MGAVKSSVIRTTAAMLVLEISAVGRAVELGGMRPQTLQRVAGVGVGIAAGVAGVLLLTSSVNANLKRLNLDVGKEMKGILV